ncbi:MAG TPA: alpha/beta fold hydrolase [Candidatus Saccharibacteria bacterium]|nr:alpha/beta fold hydrolase [Candidatus Saccharibacteria bacterium]HMT55927.1 alpha/beta fold hydrolase [Candidatus Saccharibacteria bacterium]
MTEIKTFDIECSGYAVKADWYATDNSNEIILSLIGWTSNRKRYSDILSAVCEKTGMSALVFDYSGHGDSPFDIQTTRAAQHFLEVIYVFDWLKDNYPNAKISVMGSSYGGFLATQLTKYREFDNLILRAPAIYKPSDFYTLRKKEDRESTLIFRRDVEALAKHPLLARASNFRGRTLVIVHENDEQVPKETTDAYISAFNAEKYLAKGFSHSIEDQPNEKLVEYENIISDWLNN